MIWGFRKVVGLRGRGDPVTTRSGHSDVHSQGHRPRSQLEITGQGESAGVPKQQKPALRGAQGGLAEPDAGSAGGI